MDTFLLKTFLSLAKTGNFTETAKILNLSQSAISLQLSRLEELLGKKLFKRDNRNVSLTAEGEQLLVYAQDILKTERQMRAHFQKKTLKAELRFGAPEDVTTFFLPKIFGAFLEIHPEITLNVRCEFTKNLMEGFKNEEYDLILIKQDPLTPYTGSEALWQEELVWVSGEKWKRDSSLEIPLIAAPAPCVYRERAIDGLTKEGIRWRIAYTSPSIAGTIAAVKALLGIAILPKKMVPKEFYIIKELPSLKKTQIALLLSPKSSEEAGALAIHITKSLKSKD